MTSILGTNDIVGFVPTRDPKRARTFYEKTLGLKFVYEDPFAVVFNANGITLRVVDVSQVKEYVPMPFTILGWHVPSTAKAVRALAAKGVKFERYAGMGQSEDGIWKSPGGALIAWFKDPDGNVLSVSEF
jgi:catechol 2,3-dioxygenase-like lactoylglutathione lyase family enzyme